MNELNLQGLEVNDASAIDQVDIDNLLTGDGGSEEFNVADRELLHLIARDQQMAPLAETDPTGAPGYGNLQLGSNSSIDRLVSMPLGELNHSPGGFEPDPLMNSPVMNNHRNNNLSNLLAQQAQMGLEPNPMMSPQGMNQGMNHMIGQLGFQQQQQAPMQQNNDNTIQQLEQEKMKLLAKLNAINQQQDSMSVSNNSSMMGMQQQQQQQQQPPQQPQGQMSQQQMLLLMQQQMNMQQQQQQQQQQQPKMNMQSNQMASLLQQQQNLTAAQRGAQRKPSLNTAVSGLTVKEPGESPLTSFLRAKGGGGAAGGAAASVSSLKTAGINGSSASVFSSSSGGASIDPFNKGQGKLSGAMDRSIQTQSMIKQLAMSNTKGRASGRSGNAQWGSDGSKSQTYKYSGILPKHASDGHLLRNPNGPRQTGLYRQNSKGKVDLYGGLARSKGKLASRSKEQLNKLTKKSSSNKLSNTALNRLDGKDSSGALPVRASRTTGVSKYKFGVSGSMGNLGSLKNLGSLSNLEEFTNNFQHPNQQGGGGGGQYQGNAQW